MIAATMPKRIACWLVSALVVAIVGTASANEASFLASNADPALGASFVKEVHAAWQAMPAPIRDTLQQAGWRVVLAEFVVDAAPELLEASPRGWPEGMSWRQTDAVHLPQDRKLIIAEKRLNARGDVVAASRCAGVLRHELGHAFDLAQGGRWRFVSSSPDFAASYAADVAAIAVADRESLAYYLQSGSAGRQEAFAEAFGVLLGGGSDATQEQRFRASFPRTLTFVKARLQLTPAALARGRTVNSRR